MHADHLTPVHRTVLQIAQLRSAATCEMTAMWNCGLGFECERLLHRLFSWPASQDLREGPGLVFRCGGQKGSCHRYSADEVDDEKSTTKQIAELGRGMWQSEQQRKRQQRQSRHRSPTDPTRQSQSRSRSQS